MAENRTHVKEEALVDSPTYVLEEEGLLRARKMAENGTYVKEEALVDSPTYVLEEEGLLRARKMAENGTYVKEEALVDSPTYVLEEEGLLRARKMAENGTYVKEEALVDSPTSVLEEEDSGRMPEKQPKGAGTSGWKKAQQGKNPANLDCPYRLLFPYNRPKGAGTSGWKKAQKGKKPAKCGACTGISRSCNLDCPYRLFFPYNSHGEASVICKFFDKTTLLRLMKKCNNVGEITKCRKNLFRICCFLETDPVNTLLDALDAKSKTNEL